MAGSSPELAESNDFWTPLRFERHEIPRGDGIDRYRPNSFLRLALFEILWGRASELLGLKWQAVGFESLEINLKHGVVDQGKRERIPEVLDLAEIRSLLTELQQPYKAMVFVAAAQKSPFRSIQNRVHDWVFASPETRGKQPYWPENLLRRHIRPA